MLIFLYGQDTYRSRFKLNEIRERYQGIHTQGTNLKQIECSVFDFADLEAELQGQSLFKEKKLLILKNVFTNANLAGSIYKNKKLLERQSDVIVFFEEGKVSAKDSLFQFLQKSASCQEFAPLKAPALKKWIEGEFQTHKTRISPEVAAVLAGQIGNDLWHLSNEIKKLAAFSKSKGALVGAKDVEQFLGSHLEANIFATIQDIALKNKKIALEKLASHIENGESPLYLLSMIAFQFRKLLVAHERSSAFEELKRTYQKIFELDLGIKTGIVAPELALHTFISQL